MSYSFNTAGATKDEVKANIAAEFDKVVASQPIHEADRPVAQAAGEGMVDAVREPKESECILANIYGSCYGTEAGLDGASVNVTISFRPK